MRWHSTYAFAKVGELPPSPKHRSHKESFNDYHAMVEFTKNGKTKRDILYRFSLRKQKVHNIFNGRDRWASVEFAGNLDDNPTKPMYRIVLSNEGQKRAEEYMDHGTEQPAA